MNTRRPGLRRWQAAGLVAALGGAATASAASCATATDLPLGELFDGGRTDQDGSDENNGQTPPVSTPDASECTETPCITAISMSSNFACALSDEGAVYCWGANAKGQTGTGTPSDGGLESAVRAPRRVVGLSGVTQIVAANEFACALTENSSVYCWGSNSDGIIATPGDSAPHPTPTERQGFTAKVARLSGGYYHACAEMADGELMCWGWNPRGQVGPTGITTDVETPTLVPGAAVGNFSAMSFVTCGVLRDSGAACFGSEVLGGLGRGPLDSMPHPEIAPVQGIAGPVSALGTGIGYQRHAILNDGKVMGWGRNVDNELGLDVEDGGPVLTAVPIPALTDVRAITAAVGHTCALHANRRVSCWGRNSGGQLGLPPEETPLLGVPREIQGVTNVVGLSAGQNTTCALLASGAVMCWGANNSGQLGRGADVPMDPTPAPVRFPTPE